MVFDTADLGFDNFANVVVSTSLWHLLPGAVRGHSAALTCL